jgi:hypothetical protein
MRQRDHFGLVCGARGEQDKGVVIGEIVDRAPDLSL